MAEGVSELGGHYYLHKVAQAGVVHYVQAPPADVKSVAGVGYVVAESTKQYSRHRKFGFWGEIVIFLIRFAL